MALRIICFSTFLCSVAGSRTSHVTLRASPVVASAAKVPESSSEMASVVNEAFDKASRVLTSPEEEEMFQRFFTGLSPTCKTALQKQRAEDAPRNQEGYKECPHEECTQRVEVHHDKQMTAQEGPACVPLECQNSADAKILGKGIQSMMEAFVQ